MSTPHYVKTAEQNLVAAQAEAKRLEDARRGGDTTATFEAIVAARQRAELAEMDLAAARKIAADEQAETRAKVAGNINDAITQRTSTDHAELERLRSAAEAALNALAKAAAKHYADVAGLAQAASNSDHHGRALGLHAENNAARKSVGNATGQLVAITIDQALAAAVMPVVRTHGTKLLHDTQLTDFEREFERAQQMARKPVPRVRSAPERADARREQLRRAEVKRQQLEKDKREYAAVKSGDWDRRIAALEAQGSARSAVDKLRARKTELLARADELGGA